MIIDASEALFLVLRPGNAHTDGWVADVAGTALPMLADHTGPCAPIPGWVWSINSADIRLNDTTRTLDRATVRDALQTLAQTDFETAQDFALITALEHLHHGDFWADLSAADRAYYTQAARALGLADIVPPKLPAPNVLPASDVVGTVLRQFGAAVRADPAQPSETHLRAAIKSLDMPIAKRVDLVRELSPYFCRIDQIETLYHVLLPDDGPAAITADEDRPWTVSLDLPALYLREDFDTLQAIMNRLAAEPQNWASTPVMAWVLQRLTTHIDPFVPFHLFEGILRAGLVAMEARADDGRGGLHCAASRATAVHLLSHRWMCSDRMQQQMIDIITRTFGASPAFWAALEEAGVPDLPPRLTQARDRLGNLALPHCDNPEPFGFARMRLEAGGMATYQGPELLRTACAPFAPEPAPQTLPALADAARQAYAGLPQSPTDHLQTHAMELVLQVLAEAEHVYDRPDNDLLRDLTTALTRLSGLATGAVGLALTLATVQDLLDAGATLWATGLADRMLPVARRVTRNAGADLATAPALVTAATSLNRRGDQAPAQTLLQALPEPLHQPAPTHPTWPNARAIFDTLVVVYSCRAHLDTRIAALRDTWLADLTTMGVPFVVLIGGEKTELDGDILTVAAPDDYENLPLKTLRMIEWVQANTGFGHVFKIDDDCYLDAQAFFHDPTYRRHPYYGRRLEKNGPLVERAWHQPRSNTTPGRLSFEKLPRNALYADGGTGYILNRSAMTALVKQMQKPAGRALISAAYSEDKLVGALLALDGIEPSEMSYTTAVERRAAPHVPAVPQWVSGLRPSALGVTKLCHLDAGADMAAVHAARHDPRPRPARIWPTHHAPRLGFNSRALHLLSSETKLQMASEAEVAVVSVIRNEEHMLPHFLAHYRARGVTGFLIADNGSDDGTVPYLLDQPDVALFSADTEFREVDQGTDWKIALLAHYRPDKWAVIADADELLLYPGHDTRSLPNWLTEHAANADAVEVRMLDLYPEGPLEQAQIDATTNLFALAPYTDAQPFLAESLSPGPYDNATTWTSAVRHRLMPGARPELFVAQKVPVLRYKPWMQLSTSLHYASDVQLARDTLFFAHFKYHADFAAKAHREIARGQYYNNAEEYRRYVALTASGQDQIYDPAVSVQWQDCDEVRALLGRT